VLLGSINSSASSDRRQHVLQVCLPENGRCEMAKIVQHGLERRAVIRLLHQQAQVQGAVPVACLCDAAALHPSTYS